MQKKNRTEQEQLHPEREEMKQDQEARIDSRGQDQDRTEKNEGTKRVDSRLVRLLYILFALLSLGYILWAMAYFSRPRYYSKVPVCRHLHIEFQNKKSNIDLDEEDVVKELKQMNLYPVGLPVDKISPFKIKQHIERIGLFRDAEVYLASNNDMYIKLDRNNPLFAVQIDGSSYYVGVNRSLMKASTEYPVPLTLYASGKIDSTMAVSTIYDLVEALENEPSFKKLFSQIYVKDNGDVSLIARVADTEVILGKSANWKEKLDNLKIFADQVVQKSGWDQFNTINLKFEGQIVTQPNVRQKTSE